MRVSREQRKQCLQMADCAMLDPVYIYNHRARLQIHYASTTYDADALIPAWITPFDLEDDLVSGFGFHRFQFPTMQGSNTAAHAYKNIWLKGIT